MTDDSNNSGASDTETDSINVLGSTEDDVFEYTVGDDSITVDGVGGKNTIQLVGNEEYDANSWILEVADESVNIILEDDIHSLHFESSGGESVSASGTIHLQNGSDISFDNISAVDW